MADAAQTFVGHPPDVAAPKSPRMSEIPATRREETVVDAFAPVLVLLAAAVVAVIGVYGVSSAVRVSRAPVAAAAFMSGMPAAEHAVSRYHVRWYSVTMLFLAFDMEMVFMYPWVLVVGEMGSAAVVEMFLFLAVLVAAVVYARREGALRWT